MLQQLLFVAAGGSLGAAARYGLSVAIARSTDVSFPWGTFVVNLTGSFAIGALAQLFDAKLVPSEWRSFLTIGVVGGYTTFSTLVFETVKLLRDGEWVLASLNLVASNVLGVACVIAGMTACSFLLKRIA